MTSDIPHPLSEAQAMAWLRPGRGEVRFAIELDGQLIGGAGFYRRRSGAAELGFWLGRPWWGCGYATEATRAVVRYGFEARRLPGFTSSHFVDNQASAGVLRKLCFEPVGRGTIACIARGCEMEAVTYWLPPKRTAVGQARAVSAPAPRWRAWLNRLAGRPA
jgi:RimJ/RimL family protein N-acetyltransferase